MWHGRCYVAPLGGNMQRIVRPMSLGAVLAGIVAISFVGSACTRRCTAPRVPGGQKVTPGLVFNPEWTGLAVFEPGRTDWPSVVASERPEEAVDYQEVI